MLLLIVLDIGEGDVGPSFGLIAMSAFSVSS
jgi:hypothetical protein